MAAAAEGMEFFTNAVPLWRALPQLRGWLHAKVTVVQRGVGGGGNSKHHSLFTPDQKTNKTKPKKCGVKTIQVYSWYLISVSQICHFWPFDLSETRGAMVDNDKQQITSKRGFSFFGFFCTPATGLYFIYVNMWQQWWQDDRTNTLCANKHQNSNRELPRTQAHSICLCLSGRWLQRTAALAPSLLPRWSLLSPFSLGERVVGLFGTAQPLCFLPGRPQEAGSTVILTVASRGGRTLQRKDLQEKQEGLSADIHY